MTADLSKVAAERGIQYFLISYVDLFGVLRAKLAPAAAIGAMQKNGAGFAGFASHLDMTPAHADTLAIPDPASLIQLPWKPEVGWLAADLYCEGKPVPDAPRNVLRKQIAKARDARLPAQDRRRMRVLPAVEGRPRHRRFRRRLSQALLRPARADAAIRPHQEDLRFDAAAGLEPLSERP